MTEERAEGSKNESSPVSVRGCRLEKPSLGHFYQAASEEHAATSTTHSTQNLQHLHQWLRS